MNAFAQLLAAVVALGAVAFLGSIGWVIAMVTLVGRGVQRRLPAALDPVFSVAWTGRLDALREGLITTLGNRAPWTFQPVGHPRVSIGVAHLGPPKWKAVCVVLLGRDGKRVIVDVRSAHPVFRPRRRLAAEVVALVEQGLLELVGPQAVQRSAGLQPSASQSNVADAP